MEKEDFVRLVLPEFVVDNFDAVSYSINGAVVNIELDEKPLPPVDGGCKFISKGFTAPTTIQDYPMRSRIVYLHIRRRKWLNTTTNKVVSKSYELSHYGTSLSKEFVAFLKEYHRE